MADATTTDETVKKADYDKLQEKFDRTRGELEDVKRTLKKFDNIDLEALRAKAEELDIIKREEATKNPKDLDAWKAAETAKIRAEVAKELETATNKAKELEKQNREYMITEKVFSLAADRFNADCHEEVKEKIRRSCDIDEHGEIFVKNERGEKKFVNGNKPMTGQDFIDALAKEKTSWVAPEFTPGVKQNGEKTKTIDLSHIKTLEELNKLPNPKEAFSKMSVEQKQDIARSMPPNSF